MIRYDVYICHKNDVSNTGCFLFSCSTLNDAADLIESYLIRRRRFHSIKNLFFDCFEVVYEVDSCTVRRHCYFHMNSKCSLYSSPLE